MSTPTEQPKNNSKGARGGAEKPKGKSEQPKQKDASKSKKAGAVDQQNSPNSSGKKPSEHPKGKKNTGAVPADQNGSSNNTNNAENVVQDPVPNTTEEGASSVASPATRPPPKKKTEREILEKGRGLVKAVPSGDTVIVVVEKQQPSDPLVEKEISLTSLTAPRLARPNSSVTTDENYASESRDFLRRKVLGQVVSYTIEGKNPKTGREYGFIYLNDENVAKSIAAEGWAKVYQTAKESKGELGELQKLGQEAFDAGRGIFNTDPQAIKNSVRKFATKYDALELYHQFKRRGTFEAFVDQVRNGSQLRVLLTDKTKTGETQYYNVLIRVAGANSPGLKPSDPNNKDSDLVEEPGYQEAKFFTEARVLHRNVQLTLTGIDHREVYAAKVNYEGKSLGDELLHEGFAEFIEGTAPPTESRVLQSLEQTARQKHLGLWKNQQKQSKQQGQVQVTGQTPEFSGKVKEIISVTTIVVRVREGGKNVRKQVLLSSITPPKFDEKEDEVLREALRWKGREFLRKRLIGKPVRVVEDYVRQGTTKEGAPETRSFSSVFLDKTNVAMLLVERGLASVVPHRQNEKRSSQYDVLLIAERNAQKKRKGKFAKEIEPHRFVDLTGAGKQVNQQEIQKKVKQFFPFLKKASHTSAIIEYVHSAAKFKVYVPQEGCMLNLILQGVKVPQKSEPYAEESLEFARDKLLQHDVEIEIDDVDKYGNFAGNLFLDKRNFSVLLLERGYGSLRSGAARIPNYQELLTAESRAKDLRKNIWADYDEEEERQKALKEEQEREQKAQLQKEIVTAVVTEILDGGHFYIQIKGEEHAELEKMMQQLQQSKKTSPPDWQPRRGDKVCALFGLDNKWYRALIREVIGAAEPEDPVRYAIFYVDYGNVEVVTVDQIRPLDPAFLKLTPQAKECYLACIRVP